MYILQYCIIYSSAVQTVYSVCKSVQLLKPYINIVKLNNKSEMSHQPQNLRL